MAQVKAKTVCFIDNALRQEGDVFEYNGVQNSNVVLVGAAEEKVANEPAVKQKSPKAKRNAEDLG